MTERGGTALARRSPSAPPVTPDGRYIVVRGKLWRRADPSLPPIERDRLVRALMDARRAVGAAKRAADATGEAAARAAVDRAKRGLGERGPAWWSDGAPDFGRHLARNTPYAAWFAALPPAGEPPRQAPPRAPRPGPGSRE